jgi:DNA-binding transcriptional LysR family regulator
MGDGGSGPGEPREVASVRLFDGRGAELTTHMALVGGTTTRVEVRLYAADGRQLAGVTGGLELGFSFDPDSVASSTPVAEDPLVRVVTPGPPGTPGRLTVILQFLSEMSTKTFGTFDVLVH